MREIFSNSLDYSVGLVGSVVISGTSPVAGVFQGFSVNNNAIISAALDENGNNVVSQFGGQTLKRGLYWGLPKGKYFTSITLSSGSLIAYGVRTPSTFDVDAQAFFDRVATAGGTLTTTEQTAINTLVIQMKADGIWTKMKAIYPMVGASAAACAQNLKSSSFTGTFSSGWTFASTGVTPNGTSAFMQTDLNPLTTLGNRNIHISHYSRAGSTNQERTLIGTASGQIDGAPLYNVYTSTKAYATLGGAYVDATIGSQLCFHTLTSIDGSTNGQRLYTNGILRGTTTNNTVAFRNDTILIARGYAYSPFQCAFASIGDGLTDTEATNFYTAVQAFQTTLGRQI